MRSVRSPLSARRKKRFRNPTFIGLTRVSRVKQGWGKSPALYNGASLLVLFNHMGLSDTFQQPSRHIPDAFQKPSRHPSETLQTTINKGQQDTFYSSSRHLTYTFQTPSIHNLDNIKTLQGQMGLNRSILGLPDTSQTPSRNLPDTF